MADDEESSELAELTRLTKAVAAQVDTRLRGAGLLGAGYPPKFFADEERQQREERAPMYGASDEDGM